MALIKCPECGKMISDKSTVCIGCGCPIAYAKENTYSAYTAEEANEKGRDYYFGRNGCPQDYVEALKWFQVSAEKNDLYGLYSAGFCYSRGQGCEVDYEKAYTYFLSAAEMGDAYSQKELGILYENGAGVRKCVSKAISWYLKAAEKGLVLAQMRLADVYFYFAKDYFEAEKWYELASLNGDERAKEMSERCKILWDDEAAIQECETDGFEDDAKRLYKVLQKFNDDCSNEWDIDFESQNNHCCMGFEEDDYTKKSHEAIEEEMRVEWKNLYNNAIRAKESGWFYPDELFLLNDLVNEIKKGE